MDTIPPISKFGNDLAGWEKIWVSGSVAVDVCALLSRYRVTAVLADLCIPLLYIAMWLFAPGGRAADIVMVERVKEPVGEPVGDGGLHHHGQPVDVAVAELADGAALVLVILQVRRGEAVDHTGLGAG